MVNRKHLSQNVAFGLFRLLSLSVVGILFAILGFIIYKGIGVIDWEFLTTAPTNGMTAGGILPAIVGTFCLMAGSALFAFPVGVMSGIYMNEYVPKGWVVRFIRMMTNNLSGIPSIVFGLFGMALFVNYMDFGDSILAGSLTLGSAESAFGYPHHGRSTESHPRQHARRKPRVGSHQAPDHLACHPADGDAQYHHRTDSGAGARFGRDGTHPFHLCRLLPAATADRYLRPVHGASLSPLRHLYQRHRYGSAASHCLWHSIGADTDYPPGESVGKRPAEIL